MFAQMMIPHHQQAKEMSQVILAKDGIDPKIRSLAERIVSTQSSEILQMQGWLAAWNETLGSGASPSSGASETPEATASPSPGMGETPETSTSPSPGMGESPETSTSPSPGMGESPETSTSPSPDLGGMREQMQLLEKAQGTEAERLYLTQMSAHHETAVQMAEQEVQYGSDPAAVALAKKIAKDQSAQIQEMKDLLAKL
jgi:uncharacterized protein (DUF305 family)